MDNETTTVLIAVPDESERSRLLPLVMVAHEIVGIATDADTALDLAVDTVPDVAVLHERLGAASLASLCAALHEQTPATRVLLVTSTDDETTYAALRNGLFAAVRTTAGPEGVAEAVRATACGESLLLTSLASRLLDELGRLDDAEVGLDPADRHGRLTMTEREVLGRLARGESPETIAEAHDVTSRLVNLHAGYAVAKLHDVALSARRFAAAV
jgi:DNA-binding NarL/FixJ family response regulator